jgi:hypothetical protein
MCATRMGTGFILVSIIMVLSNVCVHMLAWLGCVRWWPRLQRSTTEAGRKMLHRQGSWSKQNSSPGKQRHAHTS